MTANASWLYERYTKPELGRLLAALRLDVNYERGVGDLLFYEDEQQGTRSVVDFLGGYGASLFGHNHPVLVTALTVALNEQRVFNGQKSVRAEAARLSEALSVAVGRATGRSYIVTLANSGAEAVEIAIKHAALSHQQRMQERLRSITRTTSKTVRRVENGELTCAPELMRRAWELLGGAGVPHEISEVAARLMQRASRTCNARPQFLAFERAFHGLTSSAVQLTAGEQHRGAFEGLGVDVVRANADDIARLREVIRGCALSTPVFRVDADGHVDLVLEEVSPIAAAFIEPLQGEGGIRPLSREFVHALRECADEAGFPLVLDEIQSGMGRTGTFLYAEQLDLRGDYVLLGKSLGGGLTKLAAVLIDSEQYRDEFSVVHSSTFAEDALSSTVGLAALELLSGDKVMERCRDAGALLREQLTTLQTRFPNVIREIRGVGLMMAVVLNDYQQSPCLPLRMLAEQRLLGYLFSGYLLHRHGIRVGPTLSDGTTIRLEPSAYVSQASIECLVGGLARLCALLDVYDVAGLVDFIADDPAHAEPSHTHARARIQVVSGEPVRARSLDELPQVAFVAHFASASDIGDWEPSFAQMTKAKQERLLDRIHDVLAPTVHERAILRSVTGKAVCLNVIGLCADARLMSQYVRGRNRDRILRHLEAAVQIADDLGCAMLGLGGYTSIVTGNGMLLRSDRVALTTGNALTVGMGLAAIRRSASAAGIGLREARFTALGAAGNVASIYAEMAAEEVRHVHLVGRAGAIGRVDATAGRILRGAAAAALGHRDAGGHDATGVAAALRAIASTRKLEELLQQPHELATFAYAAKTFGSRCPVTVGADLAALRESDVVLSASNTAEPVILPGMLGDHPTLICDIAVPPDVDPRVEELHPRCVVIQGGVVSLPCNPEFRPPGSPLPHGRCYACLAETTLLGFEGIRRNFSFGAVTRVEVERAMQMAKRHGFALAEMDLQKNGYNLFSREIFAKGVITNAVS